jgi:hypothetical protein
MRRLFWVGVGVTITVVVVIQGRRLVARYAPAALVDRTNEQARVLGERFTAIVADFKSDFREARAEREHDLIGSLLAEGQGDLDTLRDRRETYLRSRELADAAPSGNRWNLPDDERPVRGDTSVPGRSPRAGDRSRLDDGKRDDTEESLGYSF